jgi:CheY-like chemotaxis protein
MKVYSNIYLIDDDYIYLSITSKTMQNFFQGSRVRTFANPENALERISKDNPDVVFLDINMPGMDGWEFLEELRERGMKVETFIVSSSIDPADLRKAEAHPYVVKFLEKPLGKKQLEKYFGYYPNYFSTERF